jgi:hypothetical protein
MATVFQLEVILELLKRRAIGAAMHSLEALIEELKTQDAMDCRQYALDEGIPEHILNQ